LTQTTGAGPKPVSFERIYAQATDVVRRDARRIHELAERYREQYRARLQAWMQLRSRFERAANGRGERVRATAVDKLRAEHELVGRELALLQGRLKRLDTAARQLDLVWTYLGSTDPTAEEPDLAESDESPEAVRMRIIRAHEEERHRLAEEVHDGPAQVLTNAIFQLEYLDRVVDSSPRTAKAELAFLRTMLRDGLEEVRGFISTLRPPALDVGMEQALGALAAEFEGRCGIGVVVDVAGIDAHLTPDGKTSVLRIVQEALANVRRHAAATQVRLFTEGTTLIIEDNGRGFDVMRLASATSRNFGLKFMRERAELMGSMLRIESRQGEGTRILLTLPNTH
jgi:two-component system, NarL family, sensor histidine kinase DegS